MKHFILFLFIIPFISLQSQGKYDEGFDSLKWKMTVDKVKLIFAADTISQLSATYFKDIFMKDNSGKIVEYTYQHLEAKVARSDYNLDFICRFIDNALCSIEILPGRDNAGTFGRIFQGFMYLYDKKFLINTDKYPEDKDGWRTDDAVMIKLDGRYDHISLFLKDLKETYDRVIKQLNSPNREIGRIIDIKG